MRYVAIAILGLTGAGTAFGGADDLQGPPPDARALLEKAIDYRTKIDGGKVVMRVVTKRNVDQPVYERMGFEWTLAFRGKDVRCTMVETKPDGTIWSFRKLNTAKLYVDDSPTVGPAFIRNLKEHKKPEGYLFHPRILGLVPSTVFSLDQFGVQRNLLPGDYILGTTRLDRLGATPAWLCESRSKIDTRVSMRVWIAPQMDHAVLGVECDSGGVGGSLAVNRVESTYEKYGSTWFPKQVTLVEKRNGEIDYHQVTTVESATFGSMPDREFTIDALGLVRGREFLIDATRTESWVGDKLVPSPPSVRPKPVEISSRWGYWAAAVALGLAGLVLVLVIVRRRNR